VETLQVIFESEVKVPSAFSANDPDAPFTVKTASEGSDTPIAAPRRGVSRSGVHPTA